MKIDKTLEAVYIVGFNKINIEKKLCILDELKNRLKYVAFLREKINLKITREEQNEKRR